jgi:hypothetical protein
MAITLNFTDSLEPIVEGHTTTLADHESRLDALQPDGTSSARLDTLEPIVAGHTTSINSHAVTLADHESRLDAIEAHLVTIDTRLDALESSSPPPATVPYPEFLTSKGITGWNAVFNPDMTRPVAELVGPDAVNTPFSWNSPPYDGHVYGRSAQSVSDYVQTGTGLRLQKNTSWGTPIWTIDHAFNGFSVRSDQPWYVEISCRADSPRDSLNVMYTAFLQDINCYKGSLGGNRNGVGTGINRPEIDLMECYLGPSNPNFGTPYNQVYASTIISSADDAGPDQPQWDSRGLNQPHVDPAVYGVPSGGSLWGRKIKWGVLLRPGIGINFSRDGVQIGGTYAIPPLWNSVPSAPSGPSYAQMWLGAFIHQNNFGTDYNGTATLDIFYYRCWKPAA